MFQKCMSDFCSGEDRLKSNAPGRELRADLMSFSQPKSARRTMRYRVYSGPRGSAGLAGLEKERSFFKEFDTLDDALVWARHLDATDRVALAIDGDDGTSLGKQAIAAALKHSAFGEKVS
jgi:hypothetical protein